MRGSFGGRRPYFADFELADDLSPDPFSEEPLPHSLPHTDRSFHAAKHGQNKEKQSKTEKNGA